MTRKAGANILQEQFAELGIHQELNEAKLTIDELTVEIERLKKQGNKEKEKEKVSELHSNLQDQGLVELSISKIKTNPHQPRQTFNRESLLVLARSLERDGLQQPILVFEISSDQYFLFDGERRWRAAQKIGWAKIKAVILPTPVQKLEENPEFLRRQALLVNHHRENLNPLDLAEAIVAEIEVSLGINKSQTPKLLSAVMTRFARKKQLPLLSALITQPNQNQQEVINQWQEEGLIKELESPVLLFLLSLQLNPISIKTNIFPTLNLFDDLKEAIRSKGLGGHQARLLQRLSAQNLQKTEMQSQKIRQKVTQEVIEKNLSVNASREKVKQEISRYNGSDQLALNKVTQSTLKKIEKLEVKGLNQQDLKTLENSLAQKLKEIRAALKSGV